jgi:hypothetical protein
MMFDGQRMQVKHTHYPIVGAFLPVDSLEPFPERTIERINALGYPVGEALAQVNLLERPVGGTRV